MNSGVGDGEDGKKIAWEVSNQLLNMPSKTRLTSNPVCWVMKKSLPSGSRSLKLPCFSDKNGEPG